MRLLRQLNPDRVEIAHAQYYGWALANRAALMPTREQVEKGVAIVAEAEKRLAGRMRIDSVIPDYYAKYPKACMGGWGQKLMLVNPSGKVLPCHAAEVLPQMTFENVRGPAAAVDLGGIRILSALPRRIVDAGTLPQLRSPL